MRKHGRFATRWLTHAGVRTPNRRNRYVEKVHSDCATAYHDFSYAEGVITFTGWSPYAQTPGNLAFIENYRATYGQPPDAWAAQSYATLYILSNAIENAPSTEAAAIRDTLAETIDFPTILGNFSFDANGEAVYDPILQIVKDAELQVLE